MCQYNINSLFCIGIAILKQYSFSYLCLLYSNYKGKLNFFTAYVDLNGYLEVEVSTLVLLIFVEIS